MTFSNPQYPVYQTAPYIDQSTGKDVRTALVGDTQSLEDQSVLELPTNYGVTGGDTTPPPSTDPCNDDNFGDVELILSPAPGQSGVWPPVVGETFLATFGGTEPWLATCTEGAYSATFSSSDTNIAEINNGDFDTLVRPLDPSSPIANGGTVIGVGPIQAGGDLTITVVVDAPDAPGKGTMTASQTITIPAAPAPGVSFTSFTSSSISDGESLSSNSPYHFNGSPNGCTGNNRSPQLSWAVDDDSDVDLYVVEMTDITSPWNHWNIEVPKTVTTMAEDFDVAGAGGTVSPNDWDNAGVPGSNANGYGGPCPPGSQHTYRIQIAAITNLGALLATSDPIEFTA